MAFVSEEIVEKNEEYCNSIGFTALDGSPKKPWWWVIDRDRNIIMTSRGGVMGEPWMGYQLYMDGYFVNMIADYRTEGSRFDNNLKVEWSIQKIEIPQGLIENEDSVMKIQEIIREAFACWGRPGVKQSQITGVTVEFMNEEKMGRAE